MKSTIPLLILAIMLAGCGPSHEAGSGLPKVDWLPATASNVTFTRNSGLFWNQTYECAMSKSDFDQFAAKNGWAVAMKKDVTTGFRNILGLPPVRTFYGTPTDYYPEALVYEKYHSNSGGIQVIYDLERAVLFVHESSN